MEDPNQPLQILTGYLCELVIPQLSIEDKLRLLKVSPYFDRLVRKAFNHSELYFYERISDKDYWFSGPGSSMKKSLESQAYLGFQCYIMQPFPELKRLRNLRLVTAFPFLDVHYINEFSSLQILELDYFYFDEQTCENSNLNLPNLISLSFQEPIFSEHSQLHVIAPQLKNLAIRSRLDPDCIHTKIHIKHFDSITFCRVVNFDPQLSYYFNLEHLMFTHIHPTLVNDLLKFKHLKKIRLEYSEDFYSPEELYGLFSIKEQKPGLVLSYFGVPITEKEQIESYLSTASLFDFHFDHYLELENNIDDISRVNLKDISLVLEGRVKRLMHKKDSESFFSKYRNIRKLTIDKQVDKEMKDKNDDKDKIDSQKDKRIDELMLLRLICGCENLVSLTLQFSDFGQPFYNLLANVAPNLIALSITSEYTRSSFAIKLLKKMKCLQSFNTQVAITLSDSVNSSDSSDSSVNLNELKNIKVFGFKSYSNELIQIYKIDTDVYFFEYNYYTLSKQKIRKLSLDEVIKQISKVSKVFKLNQNR